MKGVIVREIVSLVLRPSAGSHQNAAEHHPSSNPKTKTKQKLNKKDTGGNAHAKYYATITFNQIMLTPKDREVAMQLIHVYFEMFKELLGEATDAVREDVKEHGERQPRMDKRGRVLDVGKQKGKKHIKQVKGAAGFTEIEDSQSKLISAILTGVNRALPFAKIDSGDARLESSFLSLCSTDSSIRQS
jgi:ribosome biogenesis protein MAK21